MNRRERRGTLHVFGCAALFIGGLLLVAHAWHHPGRWRDLEGVTGILIAAPALWYSGFIHHRDDPEHPWRKFLDRDQM